MPNERISMRKIREVLRLHAECKLAGRAISRSLNVAPGTVYDYLNRAKLANLPWPLPESLDDDGLERLLFPPQGELPAERVTPDWSYVHQELRRPGVTLVLLWEEYKARHGDGGYQYSRFCDLYGAWARRVDVTMRQSHQAGEKLFVDYAGDTLPVTDPDTGEVRQAQLFVAVLGASNYTYAEATWSQGSLDWVGSHVRAFTFFGGVPAILVPDNLKSGVSRACRYEPDLNPAYHELARHYGTAVIPARVRKPRDKAKAEAGVQLVQRWIVAVLRDRVFFSLAELNAVIAELLVRLNAKPFKRLDGSRQSVFEAVDRPALRPLPPRRYEPAEWCKARVGTDYHVELARHHYSVPYQLARKEVELRYTATVMEVLFRGKRVASHARSREAGGHTTLHLHMPPSHLKFLEWTPERLAAWAAKRGEQTSRMAEAIMAGGDHPQQGLRSCVGLVRLDKLYGSERLEAACRRALCFGTVGYRGVERILAAGTDAQPLPTPQQAVAPPPAHGNVRGASYYTAEVTRA